MNEKKKGPGGRREEQTSPGKTERKAKKHRLTGTQRSLVALACVLAAVLSVTLAYRAVFVKPELHQKEDSSSSQEEDDDYGEGMRPRSDGTRKSKDYYTVLVMGRDTGGGGNTDTMMLASYDVTNQKLTVMNIPRDTMVNVSWDIKRINSVYNYYGGGDKGVKKVYQEISQLVGFEPDYQVIIEWDAVGKLVDAIGGVQFDVPRNMNYEDPYQDLSIHIQKGDQLLNGEQAMGVIRYRHDNNMKYGYADGDLGRIKTQQAFLKAVIEQLLQVKNVGKINQFSKIFQENVETDLSVQNLFWFGKSAIMGGLSMENVEFVTMPNTMKSCYSPSVSRQVGKNNWQSYVVPNAKELLDLVNNSLSPFTEVFTLKDLDIMSVNSDGSVSSSTGHVEDARAAKTPVLLYGQKTDTKEPEQSVTDGDGNPVDPETGLPVTPEDGTGTTTPGTTTPGTTDPGTTTPGTTTPGTTDPGTTTPGTTTPGTTDPGTTTPGTTDPGGSSSSGSGTQTDPSGEGVFVPPEVTEVPSGLAE
ncbi:MULTISPECIES: LCP family protein [unclassified Oscillibacter]|uniref:LCP family protein n=1 Tax=unclassified Oscillibacter TaxID=2629304 RepID=UPI0025DAC30C|nr:MULTISPECIES: LCP family protein [unclassified Oscillibacter]